MSRDFCKRLKYMHIDQNTILCISIAQKPSKFGVTVHNAAYRSLGLNYIYKACQVSDLKGAIAGMRALGVRGCGVTMPFKEDVIQFLDEVDPIAAEVGAVNTIVNQDGRLKGYNTDVYGATQALEQIGVQSTDHVLILGAGGVAKAIIYALKQLNVKNLVVANRTIEKTKDIVQKYNLDYIDWEQRNNFKADVLINATSIGMAPQDAIMPINLESIINFRFMFDVIVTPIESRLIRESLIKGLRVSPGYKMSLYQAVKQFELYTQEKAPIEVMEQSIKSLLGGK